jgi:pimeloyl-ACP methyl ester carboxylesterase
MSQWQGGAQDAELLEFQLPAMRLRALAWGPPAGRLLLCLHGFPDSATGWHRLAPMLAQHGYRVVAPFTRGYWPSELPDDGDYHMGALMNDVLDLHRALGGSEDAVLIGHDWGAWTTNAIAATEVSPFAAHVTLAFPPVAAFDRTAGGALVQLGLFARQLRMSWYVLFFQLPWLPQRLVHRIIPRLWRDWSPKGTDVDAGVADALGAQPTVAHRTAAVAYYRSMARWWSRPAARYADLHRYRFQLPVVPTLLLHGAQDGGLQVGYTANVTKALPPGSRAKVIEEAGHFLQLDRPDAVCAAILDYLGHDAAAPIDTDSDVRQRD